MVLSCLFAPVLAGDRWHSKLAADDLRSETEASLVVFNDAAMPDFARGALKERSDGDCPLGLAGKRSIALPLLHIP